MINCLNCQQVSLKYGDIHLLGYKCHFCTTIYTKMTFRSPKTNQLDNWSLCNNRLTNLDKLCKLISIDYFV